MGEAEEVAAFLAPDAASYVTGTCVNVDGFRHYFVSASRLSMSL